MNLKRMMALVLLLTLGSGMGFADSLTKAVQKGISSSMKKACNHKMLFLVARPECEELVRKIENNEVLEFFRYPKGLSSSYPYVRLYKHVLTKAAQNALRKYGDYRAYRNAAIIYVIDDGINESRIAERCLNVQSKENVRLYATEAIKQAPTQKAKAEMYYVRALADINYYGLTSKDIPSVETFAYYHDPGIINGAVTYNDRDSVKKIARQNKGALENHILPDFEKVGKISPKHAPWDWMEFMYNVLGKTTDAKRCQDKYNVYGK